MKKYSLWRDAWEAGKLGRKDKGYEDERARIEIMDVLVKARSLTLNILLVLIVALYIFVYHPPFEALRINVEQYDTVVVMKFITSIIFVVIYFAEYTNLLRFANRGIVRHNKAAGTALWGLIFPLWIHNMLEDVFEWYKDDSLHFPISSLVTFFVIIIMYLFANHIYNRVMNVDED